VIRSTRDGDATIGPRWATKPAGRSSSGLLHDDTLEAGDRVAGWLVLPYGQQPSRIVAITRDQVTHHDGAVHLHLSTTYVEISRFRALHLTGVTQVGSPPGTV
jgi:hypothetical protein